MTSSKTTTRFRHTIFVGIPSPPLEERARERRPNVQKSFCHNTRNFLNSRTFLLGILTFCFGLGLPAIAQQRPGGAGGTTPTRAAGAAGGATTPRQYPNS